MTPTNNIDRELGQSNELQDEELEQVVGGDLSFTHKIDKASPILLSVSAAQLHPPVH